MIEMKCCDILGTRILVTNMADTVERIEHDMEELRGKYICVGNVHTTVMAHDDAHYHEVQKSAAFVLPDGKPLSVYSRKHGFPEAERVTGPDLMLELFARENGLKHYFYGGSPETLQMLEQKLKVHGVMIGVGAGFDYHAGNIKRAPMWMQKLSLEWLYRLMQDPKRLFKRYLVTNTRYLWLTRTKRQ